YCLAHRLSFFDSQLPAAGVNIITAATANGGSYVVVDQFLHKCIQSFFARPLKCYAGYIIVHYNIHLTGSPVDDFCQLAGIAGAVIELIKKEIFISNRAVKLGVIMLNSLF